jgi:hypothetical protein
VQITFFIAPLLALLLLGSPRISVSAAKDPNTERAETPSRGDVVQAMNGVSAAVAACGRGQRGLVPVRFVFDGATGRVSDVSTQASGFTPDVIECVLREVRGARVPPFRQPQFSVNYPFRL